VGEVSGVGVMVISGGFVTSGKASGDGVLVKMIGKVFSN